MNKSLLMLLALTGSFFTSSAQAPTEKTLLWQVTGKGISKPSYLFGTIHLMCPTELKVPGTVRDKFNATEELFLEINLDDPNMMRDMMAGMKMKDTSTLEGLMGSGFESADKAFQQTTGMSLKFMNTAKPFMLMSMIYPSLLGCTPASWEGEFQQMANEKKMEIKGLETLKDQMEVFEKIPYKTQADMLLKMLANIDSSKQQFNEMLDVYKSKDINQLNILTTKDEDFAAYEGMLLTERNENWIPRIEAQAKSKPTFFAFGAGHMGGEKGVINLLRKAGLSVKPVFYD